MKNISEIRYIAYSRKSTESEDRQILSLDDQKREIDEMIRRDNLKVVEGYLGSERGESRTAHKRGRPIFNHVMQQIEAGRANGLLVWHANRIARNAYDGGLVITLMDEGKLQEIRTAHHTYYNTPDDKFFLQLEFGMAKKSSDDNGVAVKRALKTKVEMGWYPSRAPLGYLNTILKDRGSNEVIKDHERFEVVKRMWQMILTGNYTPPEILKIVNDDWKFKARPKRKTPGKPLSRSTIYAIFTNPFYCGWFEYGKPPQLYKGSHEPMVTEEEFDRVQKLLGRDGRPRPQTHRFAFTGIMRCGNCGGMITAEEKLKKQLNGNVHHYVYYRCGKSKDKNCQEKMIKLENLSAQIDAILGSLTISERFKGWALKYLHEIRTNEAASNQSVLENKQKALARLTDQLQALVLKYTLPENAHEEILSATEFQSAKATLLKQKAALEAELKQHGQTVEEWVELSERTFNFACYARAWFKNGDMETKRAIFSALGSHLVLKDRKIAVNLHSCFKVIADKRDSVENELVEVRTSENIDGKRQIADFAAKCPILRGRWDLNPRSGP